jgi:hypothetical protein
MRTGVLAAVGVLLSAICLASIAFGQTTWERTYGGQNNEVGTSVQQTADGGYVVAGYTESFGAGKHDVYLVKTDALGDTLWTRAYGGLEDDFGLCPVRQTADSGYIIAAWTKSYGAGSSDFYLIKTDAHGDTLWTRTYGGPLSDYGFSVEQTTDGGYIIAGYTASYGTGSWDVYLVKTNAQGDTLWTKTYGGPGDDKGYSVQQTADGGYVIAGLTWSFGAGVSDVWLIKTNASGDTLWTRTYGGALADESYSVQQTADGGYVVGGFTASNGTGHPDFYLVKTDTVGDTLWTRTYGGTSSDAGHAVQQTTDGGYIIAGIVEFPDYYGIGLVKTNASGDTLWTKTFGETEQLDGGSVQQTADGGYIVVGSAQSLGEDSDVYLVKTNADLDVGPVSILSPRIAESGQVYLPSAVVRNFGLTRAIFPVTINIGSSYAQTVQETLTSGLSDTVVFPSWTAGPMGSVPVTCFTSLVGDEEPTNDTIRDSVQVVPPPRHDVGAVAIVSPSGGLRAGDTVIPRARIRNFGNRVERYFDVRFRIGAIYNEKVNVSDALPADSIAELTFPPWVATAGDWAVACSTVLASDVDLTNDKASSSVQVLPQTLAIAPDQSDRIEAGQSKTYRFYALINGDTGATVEVARPSALAGWSIRLRNATGANDLTDTDGDGVPDLGYVAPGESGWFSLDVTAPSGLAGDTSPLREVILPVSGHVSDRPLIADTAMLTLTLVPELSIHNYPNPFTDHTTFVIGLPEDGKASLTVYTRDGARVCRVLTNADLPAGVHLVPWDGVNDNGRTIAPGTYEYLLDYVHSGKTARIRKKLVLTRQ